MEPNNQSQEVSQCFKKQIFAACASNLKMYNSSPQTNWHPPPPLSRYFPKNVVIDGTIPYLSLLSLHSSVHTHTSYTQITRIRDLI